MALFSKLRRLTYEELEDFHTEIVAQVLRSRPDLLVKWLAELRATGLSDQEEIFVTTQEDFDPLESHNGLGSRPDITITLQRGEITDRVFVESKIGSKARDKQLSKYAEHLSRLSGKGKRTLIYITRDY